MDFEPEILNLPELVSYNVDELTDIIQVMHCVIIEMLKSSENKIMMSKEQFDTNKTKKTRI